MADATIRQPQFLGGRRRSVDSPRALGASEIWMISAMLFFLAATNGRPIWWSSLAPSLVLGGLLILRRRPGEIFRAALDDNYRIFTISLVVIAAMSLISAIATGEIVSTSEALLRCFVPLLIYFSMVGVTINVTDVWKLVGGLVAGALFMFVRGLEAFIAEWGMPTFDTLLWARYDLRRIDSYRQATLGNVGHMGLYVSLLLPLFIFAAAVFRFGRIVRAMLWVAIALGLAHLIISGSRTAIAVVILAIVPILLRKGVRSTIIFAAIASLGVATLLYQWLDPVREMELIERFLPSQSARGVDVSAHERYLSIQVGLDDVANNPLLGIGPGMSAETNRYGIPHQSIVQILAEAGLFAGLAFLIFNLAVLYRAGIATFRVSLDGAQHWRLLWLIGPASWCVFGLFGGTAFNMTVALLWAGMFHAMLALAYARVAGPAAGRS